MSLVLAVVAALRALAAPGAAAAAHAANAVPVACAEKHNGWQPTETTVQNNPVCEGDEQVKVPHPPRKKEAKQEGIKTSVEVDTTTDEQHSTDSLI